MKVDSKKIVLTGAAGGIGSAMAMALAREGGKLILVGRNGAQLRALREALPGEGHLVVQADLARAEGRSAIQQACAGSLDLLVNNAGVNHFGLFEQQTEEAVRQVLEVNILAPMLLTRLLIPDLVAVGGTVVNVGSGYGNVAFPGYCAYSTSKFALRGFSESLRRELADTGVTVQLLSPRAVATQMNSMQAVALNEALGNESDSPEQVAAALMSLLRSGKRSCQLGAPERFFAFLNGLLPGVVDSALAKKLPLVKRQAMAADAEAG